ncbi:hypothetical protein [Fodinicurvata fenggangensis]|uniref:hypothetical protein n=1 Tax=Fodinicurvata fenggangensis TaxID=1121830 RepID=UPI00047C33DE|nr:hypothetical protein [Fodinicurvata fenggangensis]
MHTIDYTAPIPSLNAAIPGAAYEFDPVEGYTFAAGEGSPLDFDTVANRLLPICCHLRHYFGTADLRMSGRAPASAPKYALHAYTFDDALSEMLECANAGLKSADLRGSELELSIKFSSLSSGETGLHLLVSINGEITNRISREDKKAREQEVQKILHRYCVNSGEWFIASGFEYLQLSYKLRKSGFHPAVPRAWLEADQAPSIDEMAGVDAVGSFH